MACRYCAHCGTLFGDPLWPLRAIDRTAQHRKDDRSDRSARSTASLGGTMRGGGLTSFAESGIQSVGLPSSPARTSRFPALECATAVRAHRLALPMLSWRHAYTAELSDLPVDQITRTARTRFGATVGRSVEVGDDKSNARHYGTRKTIGRFLPEMSRPTPPADEGSPTQTGRVRGRTGARFERLGSSAPPNAGHSLPQLSRHLEQTTAPGGCLEVAKALAAAGLGSVRSVSPPTCATA